MFVQDGVLYCEGEDGAKVAEEMAATIRAARINGWIPQGNTSHSSVTVTEGDTKKIWYSAMQRVEKIPD